MDILPDALLMVKSKNTDGLRIMLEKGINLEARDSDGYTLLHIAAIDGESGIIKMLLDHGADVNAVTTSSSDTALTLLVSLGSSGSVLTSVRKLLKTGVDINHQEKNGWSALMLASRKGTIKIVQELLSHKPRLDLQNVDGSTALMFAVEMGHVDVVSLLVQAGANLDIQNTWSEGGATALTIAADQNHKQAVELLVNAGANVNLQTKRGMSALITACALGYREIAQMLLQHKADVSLKNIDGHDAMQFAIAGRHSEIVGLLREYDATIIESPDFIPIRQGENTTSGMMVFGTEEMTDQVRAGAREMVQAAIRKVERENTQSTRSTANRSMEAMELYNAGIQFANDRQWINAIDVFDKAALVQPDLEEAWLGKGVALSNIYCFPEAVACFDQALYINNTNAVVWYSRGLAFTYLRRGDEAIQAYQRAIELEPSMEQAWHNMAEELLRLGKKDQAIACYERALSLDPDDQLAWYGLGKVRTDLIGMPPTKRASVIAQKEFEYGMHNLEKAVSLGYKKASETIEEIKKEQEHLQKLIRGDDSINICERCGHLLEGFECSHCGNLRWGQVFFTILISLGCVGTTFLSIPGFGFLKYVGGVVLLLLLLTIFSSRKKGLEYERLKRSAYQFPFATIKQKADAANRFSVILCLAAGALVGYGFSLLTSQRIHINLFTTLVMIVVWAIYSLYVWAGICLSLEDRKKAFEFISKAKGMEFILNDRSSKWRHIAEFEPSQLGSLIGGIIGSRRGLIFTVPFGLLWGYSAINYDLLKPLAGMPYIDNFISPTDKSISLVLGMLICVGIGVFMAKLLGWMTGMAYKTQ